MPVSPPLGHVLGGRRSFLPFMQQDAPVSVCYHHVPGRRSCLLPAAPGTRASACLLSQANYTVSPWGEALQNQIPGLQDTHHLPKIMFPWSVKSRERQNAHFFFFFFCAQRHKVPLCPLPQLPVCRVLQSDALQQV